MSYNSLHVPLDNGTWQCQLMLAREFYSPVGGFWDRFGEWKTRVEREREIDEDKRDFYRYFRPGYDFSRPLSSNVRAVSSFLRDHLRVCDREMPASNADIERILKQAVRDEKLVPVVNRRWRSYPQTFRPAPAPERWTQRGGGGFAEAGKSFHQLVMERMGLDADAASDYLDKYDALVRRADEINARYASKGSGGEGGGLLGAVETVVGAVRGGNSSSDDDIGLPGVARSFATPLGDAQPFEYVPEALNGNVDELAASTNNPNYAAKMLGYERKTFGDMIHSMKDDLNLGGADNVVWHDNGDVEFKGRVIGNMHDY